MVEDDGRAEIVEVAAGLLSERGPAAISIRDVADAAGIPRGRVHALFPSKHDLLGAVLQTKADQIAEEISSSNVAPIEFLFESASQGDFWRILARAVLDRADPHRLQLRFPGVEILVARVEERKAQGLFDPDLDARVLVGGWLSASLGWMLFDDYLTRALGFPDGSTDATRRLVLGATLANLAYAAGPRS